MCRRDRANAHQPRPFEGRVFVLSLALALLALVFGVTLLWLSAIELSTGIVLIAGLFLVISYLLMSLLKAVIEPLRGVTNVLAAYHDGNYTIRSSRKASDDALGHLVYEVNSLGEALHKQRLQAMEATALLDKLIAVVDTAVLAFNGEKQLHLCNPAALQLLEMEADAAIGKNAGELGLVELLGDGVGTKILPSVASRAGPWQVTHGTFREEGFSQHLLIISDVRRVLREQERSAWQRLIRVISHEVNNSLTPIKSISGSLREMIGESPLPEDLRTNAVVPALDVIMNRAESLQRFLAQYSQLARLPPPRRRWVHLSPVLKRVASLEQAHPIEIVIPHDLEAYVDEDQLEQALINLIRNAVEAQGMGEGRISIEAQSRDATLVISVTDAGPGIANPDNLFVPFFTTKPGGSGIGLVLSRQIAEAHGGVLVLQSRRDASGVIAAMELPVSMRRLT